MFGLFKRNTQQIDYEAAYSEEGSTFESALVTDARGLDEIREELIELVDAEIELESQLHDVREAIDDRKEDYRLAVIDYCSLLDLPGIVRVCEGVDPSAFVAGEAVSEEEEEDTLA